MFGRGLYHAWAVRLVLLTFAILLAAPSHSAQADDSVQFNYGLSEMIAGRYATGCPALATSFRIDPRPGTLFTLAECNLRWGRTASALAGYEEYLALFERMSPEQRAKQAERAQVAAAERKELEISVPRLALRLPEGAPAGIVVRRDGVTLGGSMLGAAIPVDPGEHVVSVEMPDGRTQEQRVTLVPSEQRTIVVEPTRVIPLVPAPPSPGQSSPMPSGVSSPEPAPLMVRGSSRPVWIFAAGGVGVASLVVAGTTAALALAKKSTAAMDCDVKGICATAAGVDAGNAGHRFADVATAALIVGAVSLAVGLVLWLTEPGAPTARTRRANLASSPAGFGASW
jgi:hypothetical protein